MDENLVLEPVAPKRSMIVWLFAALGLKLSLLFAIVGVTRGTLEERRDPLAIVRE